MRYVITGQKGQIGYVTLNRVERHNSLIPEFIEEIRSAIADFGRNDQIRVIILKANGRTFSTGGDVGAFYENRAQTRSYSERVVGGLNALIMTMIDCPVPIISAVHGMLTGGSIGMVLAADIVLVSPKTTFTPYYSTVGYSPDGGWAVLMKHLIGVKRTAKVLMTDTPITAEQAVEWGIATEICEQSDIINKAEQIAERIISMKRGSISNAKHLLWDRQTVVSDLDREYELFLSQISSEEGQKGMAEFLNK
ncbi:MAG: enoyl-CoA hydratase/isomerase family protein [Peptococcia bacterium]